MDHCRKIEREQELLVGTGAVGVAGPEPPDRDIPGDGKPPHGVVRGDGDTTRSRKRTGTDHNTKRLRSSHSSARQPNSSKSSSKGYTGRESHFGGSVKDREGGQPTN